MEGIPQQEYNPEPEAEKPKTGFFIKALAAFGVYDEETMAAAESARKKLTAAHDLPPDAPLIDVLAKEAIVREPEMLIERSMEKHGTTPDKAYPVLPSKPKRKANPDIIPFAKRAPKEDRPDYRKAA